MKTAWDSVPRDALEEIESIIDIDEFEKRETTDGCPLLISHYWVICEDDNEIRIAADSRKEAIEEYTSTYPELDDGVTLWINVDIYRDWYYYEDGEWTHQYGDATDHTFEVHPPEPECKKNEAHQWESPAFLGGCSENPGVWSTGGNNFEDHEVCSKCGKYRITISEYEPNGTSITGGHLHRIRYDDPSDASIRWIMDGLAE